jgi:DNA-binding transcriptional regulator YiaG
MSGGAVSIGFLRATLCDWEQGGRKPDASSLAYLTVIGATPTPFLQSA